MRTAFVEAAPILKTGTAAPTARGPMVGIQEIIGMAMRAMGCAGVLGRRVRNTSLILKVCHRLEVRWIHTALVTAYVMNHVSFRDRAFEQFVGEAMGNLGFAHFRNVEQTISITIATAQPRPATLISSRLIYSKPESLLDRKKKGFLHRVLQFNLMDIPSISIAHPACGGNAIRDLPRRVGLLGLPTRGSSVSTAPLGATEEE